MAPRDGSIAGAAQEKRSAKIAEYERFIGDRLAPDLRTAEEAKAKVQASIATWDGLVTNVRGRGLHSSTSQLNLNRVAHNKTPCAPCTTPTTPVIRASQPLRAPPIPYKAHKLS